MMRVKATPYPPAPKAELAIPPSRTEGMHDKCKQLATRVGSYSAN